MVAARFLGGAIPTVQQQQKHVATIVSGNVSTAVLCIRGTMLNKTYGTHKNLYVSLFLLTIFGPIYYGPP